MRLIGLRPREDRRLPAEERRETFEELVRRDWDRFYRFTLHLCNGHREDAEDLLAESLVEAFQDFERYRGEGFDRWIFRILTNNRVDMVRRQKTRRAASLDDLMSGTGGTGTYEVPDRPSLGPESQLLAGCFSEPLERALSELGEEFRTVVLLCDVEGMDYQGIADLLGVPIGTVRSRLARGRNRLRERLERYLRRPAG